MPVNALQYLSVSLNQLLNLRICSARLLELLSSKALLGSMGLHFLSHFKIHLRERPQGVDHGHLLLFAEMYRLRGFLRLLGVKVVEYLVYVELEPLSVLIAGGCIQPEEVIELLLINRSRIIFIAKIKEGV